MVYYFARAIKFIYKYSFNFENGTYFDSYPSAEKANFLAYIPPSYRALLRDTLRSFLGHIHGNTIHFRRALYASRLVLSEMYYLILNAERRRQLKANRSQVSVCWQHSLG